MFSIAVAGVVMFGMRPVVPNTIWIVKLLIILLLNAFILTFSIILVPFVSYQVGIGRCESK